MRKIIYCLLLAQILAISSLIAKQKNSPEKQKEKYINKKFHLKISITDIELKIENELHFNTIYQAYLIEEKLTGEIFEFAGMFIKSYDSNKNLKFKLKMSDIDELDSIQAKYKIRY